LYGQGATVLGPPGMIYETQDEDFLQFSLNGSDFVVIVASLSILITSPESSGPFIALLAETVALKTPSPPEIGVQSTGTYA